MKIEGEGSKNERVIIYLESGLHLMIPTDMLMTIILMIRCVADEEWDQVIRYYLENDLYSKLS